jgi:pyruvate, water dikinase
MTLDNPISDFNHLGLGNLSFKPWVPLSRFGEIKMINMKTNILNFNEISLDDIAQVGGKNSSLGEMFRNLSSKGVRVPDGFATTSFAYWEFLKKNELDERLKNKLQQLDTVNFSNLKEIGEACRTMVLDAIIPRELSDSIINSYHKLSEKYGTAIHVAVRSSATAEDLPDASFAGQHESYLNIYGEKQLLEACLKCYASLFTDRAIKYRNDHGFDHMKVALSLGIQKMVRSDESSSGVIFTLEPESGFEDVVLVTGIWGLGENIVQGAVNPDEFYVYKPALKNKKRAIINKKLGSKAKTMIYNQDKKALNSIINIDTPKERREVYVLNDNEIIELAGWALTIEEHYKKHMDIEWAKDGETGEIFIVQARPETVHSVNQKQALTIHEYSLKEKGKEITSGKGIGNKIASGVARIIHSPKDSDLLKQGEILVTDITNPDWDPILKKASAIITNKGGRTSHAAIVAREMGAVAVVGTTNATSLIKDGDMITVSCAGGENGIVYEGKLKWEDTEVDLGKVEKPKTRVMYILGDPDQAFHLASYPNDGVGLMRLEFVINNSIRVHPMALIKFDSLKDQEAKIEIEKITAGYPNKENYFVENLSRAVGTIAAAFYPKDVIVRMSDFKTNEYANLLGGKAFEPKEENPMLGFRGASRYYSEAYKEGFGLECKAMKIVRDEMGFSNVKLMIPFCRTVEEGKKVVKVMESHGLKRGENGLEIYVMAEIPSNVILAKEFASVFDGFSIGSNDLTQLTLGIDRDSSTVSNLFDENNEAPKKMITMMISEAKKAGRKIGLCGQAPSDFPEFAAFLVGQGIDSISFNPDALIKGLKNIIDAEKMAKTKKIDINEELEKIELGE